ncbi:MAG TPA: hypothetical protein VK464_05790 [Symbiobacteriaceae bacterium]|nr:hypothetical protein [Symbiobacteriaceae bacterium]
MVRNWKGALLNWLLFAWAYLRRLGISTGKIWFHVEIDKIFPTLP